MFQLKKFSLQSLFEVGTTPPDVDLGVVLLQLGLGLLDGLDDALERVRHVGEVGDAAADDQELAVRVGMTAHQVDDGLGVLISLQHKERTFSSK